MQPCHDGDTMHQIIELERGALQQVAAEKKEFNAIQRRTHRSADYEILFGWLPSRWQEALSERWHFSPADATRKNGLFMVFFGLGAAWPAMTLIQRSLGFLLFFMALDGAVRWASGFAGEKPCGLLPLELAERIVHRILRLLGRPQSE